MLSLPDDQISDMEHVILIILFLAKIVQFLGESVKRLILEQKDDNFKEAKL